MQRTYSIFSSPGSVNQMEKTAQSLGPTALGGISTPAGGVTMILLKRLMSEGMSPSLDRMTFSHATQAYGLSMILCENGLGLKLWSKVPDSDRFYNRLRSKANFNTRHVHSKAAFN